MTASIATPAMISIYQAIDRLAGGRGIGAADEINLTASENGRLYDEEFGRQAFERLRAVVEAVVLTPVESQLSIELRGELAGILRVAQDGEQASELAQKNALQIKVVAGAHSHLYRSEWKVPYVRARRGRPAVVRAEQS
jgi:hypothetical protein